MWNAKELDPILKFKYLYSLINNYNRGCLRGDNYYLILIITNKK